MCKFCSLQIGSSQEISHNPVTHIYTQSGHPHCVVCHMVLNMRKCFLTRPLVSYVTMISPACMISLRTYHMFWIHLGRLDVFDASAAVWHLLVGVVPHTTSRAITISPTRRNSSSTLAIYMNFPEPHTWALEAGLPSRLVPGCCEGSELLPSFDTCSISVGALHHWLLTLSAPLLLHIVLDEPNGLGKDPSLVLSGLLPGESGSC